MSDLDVLAAALREIEAIAKDEMDLGRFDLSSILRICDRYTVRAAMVDAKHTTTITEGGLSNYTITCTCGKRWGCATTDPAFAEKSAAEHVAAFAADADPFARL